MNVLSCEPIIKPKNPSILRANTNESTADRLVQSIIEAIQEKKGNDIVRLDLRSIHESIADYFIICHADSATQVKAIADSVEEYTYQEAKELPLRKEGIANGEWALIDYGDVVVHLFKTEKRHFYTLEALWGDAETTRY